MSPYRPFTGELLLVGVIGASVREAPHSSHNARSVYVHNGTLPKFNVERPAPIEQTC